MTTQTTKLAIGFGQYDRTRPLEDGTVKIKGVDATFTSNKIITEIFAGMVRDRAFDVAEVGLSYFLRSMDFPDPPFLALPIFPNRVFRHSAIYINKNAGIKMPEDLKGKRIGEFAMYGHDADKFLLSSFAPMILTVLFSTRVWPKGILSDEYGVKPEDCRWIVGCLDWPFKPVDWLPQPHPDNIEVVQALDQDLGAMLERGEIDALISADIPKCVLEGAPNVGRLFEDYEAVERDYFKRTGIFPAMHFIAIKKELAEEHPELLRPIYDAFVEAKEKCQGNLAFGKIFNNMPVMVPWFTQLLDEVEEHMGKDWWPYGVEKIRKMVDTFFRYHYEQGLTKREWKFEDVFVKGLMDT